MENKEMFLSDTKAEEVLYYQPPDKNLRNLANFFSMFADTTRLKIISALAVCEMCVSDIAKVLKINQTTVSHQLKILKTTGTVINRRQGKIIYYSIVDKIINDCLLNGVEYTQTVNYF